MLLDPDPYLVMVLETINKNDSVHFLRNASFESEITFFENAGSAGAFLLQIYQTPNFRAYLFSKNLERKTATANKCCGSGMFVLDHNFYPSRSRIPTATKDGGGGGGGEFFLQNFFLRKK